MLEKFQPEARKSEIALKTTLLKAGSGVGAMADSSMQEMLNPPSYYLTQIRPLQGHGT